MESRLQARRLALANPVYRATRYSATSAALLGRTLTGTTTIAGGAPSYVPRDHQRTTQNPSAPYATNMVAITAIVTTANPLRGTLTCIVGGSANIVAMTKTGSVYSAFIPAFTAGTQVSYFITAGMILTTRHQWAAVYTSWECDEFPPVITNVTQSPTLPTSLDP